MPESSKKKSKPAGATASGIIEAVEQDVELTIEQVKDAAEGAMAAVEKKLRSPQAIAKRKAKSVEGAKPKKK